MEKKSRTYDMLFSSFTSSKLLEQIFAWNFGEKLSSNKFLLEIFIGKL